MPHANYKIFWSPSDVADEEEGNDCLYTMAAGIIASHNAVIEGLYSSVQAQQQSSLARFLPDEPAKVYPSEVNESHFIVGKFVRWALINTLVILYCWKV